MPGVGHLPPGHLPPDISSPGHFPQDIPPPQHRTFPPTQCKKGNEINARSTPWVETAVVADGSPDLVR